MIHSVRVAQVAAVAASCAFMLAACGRRTSDASNESRTGSVVQAETAKAAEIAGRVSGYLAAIEGADVAAAGDYWAEDARLIAPGVSLDRASLLDGMRSIFGAGTRVRVQRRTVELFVHDNAAYEIAQAEEVFATPGSARPDTTRNNMFVRWEKGADGLWRFSRAVVGPQGAGAQ